MGREQVPETGGVLLVPNHVTWIDGLLILATTDRPVRFLVEQEYFEKPFAKPLMKMLGAIPILSTGGPRALLRAIRSAGDFLDRGEVVCIFPEGQISRTGGLLPFRRGFQRLAKNRKAQIVPVYLDRLWGSIFSRAGGRFLWKLPKRIPYPVTVAFGSPMENSTPIHVVRAAVQMLGVEAWRVREGESKSLPAGFIGQARHCPWAFAFADAERSRVSRGKALAGAVLLARKLRLFWGEEPHIGILLPPSVPGAIVNLAASMAGKTIVNLNYTSGSVGMASAISQACLHTVVTSRIFLERAKIEIPSGARPVYLEDLRPSSLISRGVTFAMALFAPQQTLFRFCGAARPPRTDDVATIIFSSGSTGDPKGVMLTHFNLRSNIEAVSQVMRTERSDRVLGILPFFHSFGFLTLWLSATEGVPMPMHPNPLEAAAIGNLVLKYRVTLLVATPTFLNLYLRRVTAEQFGSLRFVLTGAERLPDRLAMAFEDRFGLRPIEGYGTTECSPVVAASVPGFRAPGFYQAGERRGFVGHPLPCVAVRVVDPETFLPLPPNKPGLLLVAGANVMKGYLERDDLTRNVIRDGWYVTGDIAAVDENGFLKITDRLSRFAKIGGEMIPLVRVEEALHEAAAADTVRFAVTTIPDERKGEQLAVLHTVDESGLDELLAKLSATGLPNLFIPKRNRFFRVETLPMLGSGKLDLRALKEIAAERALDGTNPAST
jgi:acyl-[acyl-carrier-protein]-phospholipid O-acyltransferase/long-chain-fatty-acid--[acyl-carrier-protein] ligase